MIIYTSCQSQFHPVENPVQKMENPILKMANHHVETRPEDGRAGYGKTGPEMEGPNTDKNYRIHRKCSRIQTSIRRAIAKFGHMVLPPLYAPFPSVVNPHVLEADEQVIQWVKAFQPRPEWAAYYRKAKFTWFTARCFPDVSLSRLVLAAEFNVWLFLLDDSCDEITPGHKYVYIRPIAAELILALSGYEGGRNPLVIAFADLWRRLKALGSLPWQGHFADCMIRYLDACKLEATFLDQNLHPTVDTYTRNRPYLGAVHLEPALARVLCDIRLPGNLGAHPLEEAVTLLCCNIVCWSNDLFSLEKELCDGDTHNLVLVLRHERGYSLPEAIRETAAIHNRDVRQFREFSDQLKADPHKKATITPYIRALQNIISANMEWSLKDSKRYGVLQVNLTTEL
jgi:hypothetical protein